MSRRHRLVDVGDDLPKSLPMTEYSVDDSRRLPMKSTASYAFPHFPPFFSPLSTFENHNPAPIISPHHRFHLRPGLD
jgi:hypothetical protein